MQHNEEKDMSSIKGPLMLNLERGPNVICHINSISMNNKKDILVVSESSTEEVKGHSFKYESVYVFNKVNDEWIKKDTLISRLIANEEYKYIVAISGDGKTIVMSKKYSIVPKAIRSIMEPRVTVFKHVVSDDNGYEQWLIKESFTSTEEEDPDSYFGHSIDISDNGLVIVVGCPIFEITREDQRGKVLTYINNRISVVGPQVRREDSLTVISPISTNQFGSNVKLGSQAGVLIIGCPTASYKSNYQRGIIAIYRYKYYHVTKKQLWGLEDMIVPEESTSDSRFGEFICLSKDENHIVASGYLIEEHLGKIEKSLEIYLFSRDKTKRLDIDTLDIWREQKSYTDYSGYLSLSASVYSCLDNGVITILCNTGSASYFDVFSKKLIYKLDKTEPSELLQI